MNRFIVCVTLTLILLFLALTYHLSGESSTSDFSSFWLASWWIREKPVNIPLYYPREEPDQPNTRIWGMIKSSSPEKLFHPWREYGRLHGFEKPKFYLYPPLFAVFFLPLTFFKLSWALKIWGFLNAVALIYALSLLSKIFKPKTLSTSTWMLLVFVFSLISYPVLWSLDLSQNSLLLFLLWVLLFLSLDQKKEIWAGGILGILILIKLNPILILPWLLWRRFYRTVGICVMTLLVLLSLSVAMAGWESMRIYFFELVPLLSSGIHYFENQSLLGLLLRLPADVDCVTGPAGVVDHVPLGLYHGLTILLLIIQGASLFIRGLSSQERMRREFCSWLLFLLLISPVSWSHHLVNVVLVWIFMFKEILDAREKGWIGKMTWLGFCYLWVAIPSFSVDVLHQFRSPLLLSHRFFGILFLWIFILVSSVTRGRRSGSKKVVTQMLRK